ncbi:helix-turn-helix domain-containing protein [Dokdonella soli]|uniref:helix-turn-helix domain-containing protein n=1 Tax=Dokdonella soli TaxID=529810 RepID=UPI0031DA6EEA
MAKIHRSYTVDEAARCFGVHRNTVRQWIKRGLPVCDDKRPTLVLGRDLASYLQVKRTINKRPCRPGQIYCVRCRAPRSPAGDMADYIASSATSGRLVGICPDCDALMNRRVSLANLLQVGGELVITMPQAHSRIGDTHHPFVNSDFK